MRVFLTKTAKIEDIKINTQLFVKDAILVPKGHFSSDYEKSYKEKNHNLSVSVLNTNFLMTLLFIFSITFITSPMFLTQNHCKTCPMHKNSLENHANNKKRFHSSIVKAIMLFLSINKRQISRKNLFFHMGTGLK